MTTTPLRLRFTGNVADLSAADRVGLLDRSTSTDEAVSTTVARIVHEVRARGDAALRELARTHDGVELAALEVPREAMREALATTPPDLRRAMERAAAHIQLAHAAWAPRAERVEVAPGVVVGRRPDPLGRVGVYAPGGRAVYPSSVLMGAIPARVAGVGEVVVCSPPGPDGRPAAAVLAAAGIAGVDRVFALGGAGAVAAMAFGTESVPRVDRIVGPGNAWVAEAKLQVAGAVSIDSPAGPSECLVIGDARSDARVIAREVVAQAEHDPRACAIAVLYGDGARDRAAGVMCAIADLVAAAPRREVIAEALASRGGVLRVRDAEEALAFAADYAPEHLVLATLDAAALLPRVRNAGTVFVGESSSNSFGDYLTGANHILPTGGLARSYSGLSTLDFVRWTTWQEVTPAGAASLARDVATFAEAEGLPGHAAAARAWEGVS
ncbi:MAG: histidinol dehydrogenase [bacterium]